jgi:hypothetical protein
MGKSGDTVFSVIGHPDRHPIRGEQEFDDLEPQAENRHVGDVRFDHLRPA